MNKINDWLEKIPAKKRYTTFGFFFGLFFPLGGVVIEANLSAIPVSFETFIEIHLHNPILFIVDVAPIIMSIIFSAIGVREEKLALINQNLEKKISERTAELEESNRALAIENLERRRAEKESSKQSNYFQALVENTPTAVVLIDTDEKILHCNTAFEKLYNYKREEIKGKNIDKLVAPKEYVEEAANLSKRMLTQRIHKITKRKRKDDSLVDVELFGVPLFVEDEWAGSLVIYHDISVLVEARQAAEEANRAKSEFLANMSHEIRTPMNGVIGMLDIVLDTSLDAEQQEYLTIALESAESLLTLINDILDYSKMEAKKLDLEEIAFDLRNTIEGAAYTLVHQAEEKGLALASLIPPDLPTNLLGDPSRLRQILINLTSNAVKFTEEGEVLIRAKRIKEDDKQVEILFSVQDTGIGIPTDRLEAIFERFTQADGSTTRKFGGTGLGLAISQHLVEAMGGEMNVESEYGKGANFSFTLGFSKQAKITDESKVRVKNLRGLNILIVDDNATNRIILKKMIEGFGATSHSTTSGKEGIDALLIARHTNAIPYDILLLDMQMPEMDGEQTARAIFSDPRNKNLSVVVLTSMGKRGDAKRLQKLGCAGYLLKPIKQEMLFNALVRVMNEKAALPPGTGRLVTRHLVKEEKRRKQRILLVEDNPVNQKVAIALLQKDGHSVEMVENGKKAVEKIIANTYNLVLMDVQMPVLDGISATRQIRAWEAGVSHIPIIAMTAHAMQGDRERCLEAGMDDYLSKPLDKRSLFTMIDRWGIKPIIELEKVDEIARRARVSASLPSKSSLPVDIDSALPRFSNDIEFFNEMSKDFIAQIPVCIENMAKALAEKDAFALRRSAHYLHGISATFSAEKVTGLCVELEERSGQSCLEDGPEIITEIEEEAKVVIDFLSERLL